MTDPHPLAIALLAIWAASEIYGRVSDDDRGGRDDLADAHRAYVEGEIDEAELEARVELALDPRADELRETVEQVNGIGPSTSAAIARRFESVEQVREASPDELAEQVNGVGPDRAEAICERLQG